MKATALMFLLSTCAIIPAGCTKSGDESQSKTSGSGTIGVVDLDKVGTAMGWNEEMKKNLEATKAQIGGQLNEYLDFRKKEFEGKRDEIAKALGMTPADKELLKNAKSKADLEKLRLTPAQIDELGQAAAVVQNALGEANQRLNQILQDQNQKIVKAYLDAAQPSIRRVAIANNRQVIVQPIGALYTDSQIDLTDKVVDDLQHTSGGKVDPPPVPKLDMPQFPEKAK